MAFNISESLLNLGCENPFADIVELEMAAFEGPKNLKYTNLVHKLITELKKLRKIKKTVNQINDPKDSKKFSKEVCAFLKAIKCPYKRLTAGHMNRRPQTQDERLLLLNYLVSELMAARIVASKLLQALQEQRGGSCLTSDQWDDLNEIFIQMYKEYFAKRASELDVFDATIKSMVNAYRIMAHKEMILEMYEAKRAKLRAHPEVDLMDIFEHSRYAEIKKMPEANMPNTRRNIQPLLIAQVPDYGGQIYEQQPPPVTGYWHPPATMGGFGRGHSGLLTTATGGANVGLFPGRESNVFGNSLFSPWNQGDYYLNPNRTVDWNQIPSLQSENFSSPNFNMPSIYNHEQNMGLNPGFNQMSDYNLSPGYNQNQIPTLNSGFNHPQNVMPQAFNPIPDFGFDQTYDLSQAYSLSQAYNQMYGFTRAQTYPQMPNLDHQQAIGQNQMQYYRPELYANQRFGDAQSNLNAPNQVVDGYSFAGEMPQNSASGIDFRANANNQNAFNWNGGEERR